MRAARGDKQGREDLDAQSRHGEHKGVQSLGGYAQEVQQPGPSRLSNYGGRGIRVCESWNASFAAYYADVGEAPSDFHMIDRIDNDGHYEPGNVRWVLQVAQERNKRSNRQMTIRGEVMTMKEASERFGIAYNTLANRICTLKWDDEDAVFRPVR